MRVPKAPKAPGGARGSGALKAMPAKVQENDDVASQRALLSANEKGGAHARLQSALRESNGKVPDDKKKHVGLIEQGMEPTTRRTVAYRGVQDLASMFGEHAGGNLTGQHFTEHGFTPASARYEIARGHVYGGPKNGHQGILEMHMPEGVHAADFGTAEQDALYQRGLTYKVISDMMKDHRRHIVVQASHPDLEGSKTPGATPAAKLPAKPAAKPTKPGKPSLSGGKLGGRMPKPAKPAASPAVKPAKPGKPSLSGGRLGGRMPRPAKKG